MSLFVPVFLGTGTSHLGVFMCVILDLDLPLTCHSCQMQRSQFSFSRHSFSECFYSPVIFPCASCPDFSEVFLFTRTCALSGNFQNTLTLALSGDLFVHFVCFLFMFFPQCVARSLVYSGLFVLSLFPFFVSSNKQSSFDIRSFSALFLDPIRLCLDHRPLGTLVKLLLRTRSPCFSDVPFCYGCWYLFVLDYFKAIS